MIRLGFIAGNADLIDHETRGSTVILKYIARGASKRAAVRGARKEATDIIPLMDQQVINTTRDSGSRFDQRWIVTVSN